MSIGGEKPTYKRREEVEDGDDRENVEIHLGPHPGRPTGVRGGGVRDGSVGVVIEGTLLEGGGGVGVGHGCRPLSQRKGEGGEDERDERWALYECLGLLDDCGGHAAAMQIHLACAVACADSDIGEGRATAVRFGMSAICFALPVTWLPDKDIPPVENNAQEQHKLTVTVRAHKQCPRSSRSNHPRSASDATTLPASCALFPRRSNLGTDGR